MYVFHATFMPLTYHVLTTAPDRTPANRRRTGFNISKQHTEIANILADTPSAHFGNLVKAARKQVAVRVDGFTIKKVYSNATSWHGVCCSHADCQVRVLITSSNGCPLRVCIRAPDDEFDGTHALEPSYAVPQGERSLRALYHLLYSGLDSKWSLYGLLYSMSVTVGGVYVCGKYWHNRYQVVRTSVVMLVQVSFGFSVPVILSMFSQPGYYLSYFWPLKIDAFYPDNILRDPTPFVLWSFLGSLVLVPLLGALFGKRWYCSWVCGCGGLANTAGEPWRHLSQKGSSAWRFERVSIHLTLGVALVTTLLVVLASWVAPDSQVSGVWWSGHGAPT